MAGQTVIMDLAVNRTDRGTSGASGGAGMTGGGTIIGAVADPGGMIALMSADRMASRAMGSIDNGVGLVVMVDATDRGRINHGKGGIMAGRTGLAVGVRIGRAAVGDDLGRTIHTAGSSAVNRGAVTAVCIVMAESADAAMNLADNIGVGRVVMTTDRAAGRFRTHPGEIRGAMAGMVRNVIKVRNMTGAAIGNSRISGPSRNVLPYRGAGRGNFIDIASSGMTEITGAGLMLNQDIVPGVERGNRIRIVMAIATRRIAAIV